MKIGNQIGKASRAGFTLAEVIVAVAIMAIMMVAFFAGLSFGFARIKSAREDLRATQILTQKMEAIRLCKWSQLTNLPTAFQDNYNPLGLSNNTAGITYYGTINVGVATNLDSAITYKSDMRLVTVSLTWTNDSRGNHLVQNRQMQTESSYHGIQNYIWGKQ